MDLVKIDSNKEILDREIKIRKRIHDLPEQNENMNAISIVVSYKLFGLSNDDIAQMLGITDEQVMNILSSDSFKIYYDSVLNNIMENDSENIQMEFKRLSKKMLKNIEDLADNSNVDVVKLNAAQDILDRAGYSADKLNEKQLSNEGNTLNICFIKKGN